MPAGHVSVWIFDTHVIKWKTVDRYVDIAHGRTNEAWVVLLRGLPGTCRSPTAGVGRERESA